MTLEVRNIDLCAYADRECADIEKRRIVAALAASPQLTDWLALWRRNDAALRLAVATGEASPPPQPIAAGQATKMAVRAGRARRSPPSRLKAMAVAAIAGGSGFVALASATLIFVAR